MASPLRLVRQAPSSPHPDHQRAQSVFDFVRQGNVWSLATTPIIYSLSIPLLLLDLWVTAFQWMASRFIAWHECHVVAISSSIGTGYPTSISLNEPIVSTAAMRTE